MLRQIGRIFRTYGSRYWGQRDSIPINKRRGNSVKREGIRRQIGKVTATNREGGATDWENVWKGRRGTRFS